MLCSVDEAAAVGAGDTARPVNHFAPVRLGPAPGEGPAQDLCPACQPRRGETHTYQDVPECIGEDEKQVKMVDSTITMLPITYLGCGCVCIVL